MDFVEQYKHKKELIIPEIILDIILFRYLPTVKVMCQYSIILEDLKYVLYFRK